MLHCSLSQHEDVPLASDGQTMTCQLVTQPDKRTLETKSVPYWLVNVPPERWPPECPKFLQNLPEKSLKMLSTPDHEFVRLDWPLVREIIGSVCMICFSYGCLL